MTYGEDPRRQSTRKRTREWSRGDEYSEAKCQLVASIEGREVDGDSGECGFADSEEESQGEERGEGSAEGLQRGNDTPQSDDDGDVEVRWEKGVEMGERLEEDIGGVESGEEGGKVLDAEVGGEAGELGVACEGHM